ncbi:hypothetical protein [Asticcacaulis sp. AC402]|uniref:hypothetical protein n=1 Tax=Asticcacaulis sp. AC402 TaxID=1282361 RepID=UPI0003C3CA67|nr:hypothetical protein [Asticcacaulis sp. AC402]ESQ74616.1 hypothetical protein ABAC402_13305 [Asticcacaulis sp. AC402]
MSRSIWQTLGIKRTRDQKDIRRAYARKLKETNPEDDPDGFKVLRAAYEQALAGVDDDTPSFAMVIPSRKDEVDPVDTVPVDEPAAPAQPAEPDPRQIHADLQSQLEAVLRKPNPDPDSVLAAYNVVIASPAMAMVDIHAATEDWLAWLIASRSPKSDVLIRPAIDRFHWGGRSLRQQNDRDIQQILARQRDIAFLDETRRHPSEHSGAYRVLTAPPKPITLTRRLFSPTQPSHIKAFLDTLRWSHPTAIVDMNSDAVTQWDGFLDRPHLGGWGLWVTLLSPLSLLGLLLSQVFLPEEWRALSILLGLPPVFAAAALVNLYGFEMPRRFWQMSHVYGAPAWMRYGWGLAILAVLAVAALPASPALAVIVGILSLLVAVWVRTTGRADTSTGELWQIRSLLGETYLVGFAVIAAFTMPLMSTIQMSLAVLAAVVVSLYGSRPMFDLWLSLQPRWRLASCLMVLGLTVAAAVLFFRITAGFSPANGWANPLWHAQAVALIASLTLLHRPMAPMLGEWSFRLKWYSMMALIWFGLNGGLKSLFIVSGALLLFWIGVSMIVVMVRDLQSKA